MWDPCNPCVEQESSYNQSGQNCPPPNLNYGFVEDTGAPQTTRAAYRAWGGAPKVRIPAPQTTRSAISNVNSNNQGQGQGVNIYAGWPRQTRATTHPGQEHYAPQTTRAAVWNPTPKVPVRWKPTLKGPSHVWGATTDFGMPTPQPTEFAAPYTRRALAAVPETSPLPTRDDGDYDWNDRDSFQEQQANASSNSDDDNLDSTQAPYYTSRAFAAVGLPGDYDWNDRDTFQDQQDHAFSDSDDDDLDSTQLKHDTYPSRWDARSGKQFSNGRRFYRNGSSTVSSKVGFNNSSAPQITRGPVQFVATQWQDCSGAPATTPTPEAEQYCAEPASYQPTTYDNVCQ